VVFEPRREDAQFLLPLPLQRRLAGEAGEGVRVTGILPDPAAAKPVYDPGHPDADARGYVAMPNINLVNEMVDMISATRAYEANVAAINSAKSMALKALDIGRA
jgi:flagellar basal-body rod protein FlgC